MKLRRVSRVFARIAVVAVALLFADSVAIGQPAQTRTVALREGIVVHPTLPRAFVMSVDGGVSAVNLTNGSTEWRTAAASKPLALVRNLLVAQVEPKRVQDRNRIELVSLDTNLRGAVAARGAITLPSPVRVSIGETLEGTFSLVARTDDGTVTVWWTFAPETRGGMPPESTGRIEVSTGALRYNAATGTITRLDQAGKPPANRWILPADEIDIRGSRQFESADGRHVLVSERVADDRVFEKYRWSLFDRVTRRKIGDHRTHTAFAPFVVRSNVLVYETTPYATGRGEETPTMLRGVSLDSGTMWRVPVRETVWRRTMPP